MMIITLVKEDHNGRQLWSPEDKSQMAVFKHLADGMIAVTLDYLNDTLISVAELHNVKFMVRP